MDEIVVVSGLPRSGTSMMMQVMQAGGIGVLSDGERSSDDDNPAGYLELEAVKALPRGDTAFLADARGKAVKVIHALLKHLPPDHRYRVVFMVRDLREVVASQRRMLERQGRKGAGLTDQRLADVFGGQRDAALRWLEDQPNFQTLVMEYAEAIAEPERRVQEIDRFLGGGLDVGAMARAIDPRLHRQKAAPGGGSTA